jgi:DNA invertase Pin-like site-specific DNA recombinase
MAGRVFAYVRCSTPAQRVAEQEYIVSGWAADHGRTIAATYADEGVSGGVPLAQRSAGARLCADLRRGDIIVAAWFDRLFRLADDCLGLTERWNKQGVGLFVTDFDHGNADVTSGVSRLIIHVAATFSEQERVRLSQRIRSAKQAQRAAGIYLGGIPRFGWSYDESRKLVPVPEQQKAIQLIHQLRGNGHTLREIAVAVVKSGVPISHGGVANVLKAMP